MVAGLKRLVETLSLLDDVREALSDAHLRKPHVSSNSPPAKAAADRGQARCSSVVAGAIRQLVHDMQSSPFLRSLSLPPRLLPVPEVAGGASPRPLSPRTGASRPRSPMSPRRVLPASPHASPRGGDHSAADDRQGLAQQVERLTSQLHESMAFYTGRVSTLKSTLETHRSTVNERLERDANQVRRLCAAMLAVLVTLADSEGLPSPMVTLRSKAAGEDEEMEDEEEDGEAQRELRLLNLLDRVREALH